MGSLRPPSSPGQHILKRRCTRPRVLGAGVGVLRQGSGIRCTAVEQAPVTAHLYNDRDAGLAHGVHHAVTPAVACRDMGMGGRQPLFIMCVFVSCETSGQPSCCLGSMRHGSAFAGRAAAAADVPAASDITPAAGWAT